MSSRCLLLFCASCLGCTGTADVVVDEPPPPAVSTDFSRLADVLAGIQATAEISVYEGLPSDFWEPLLREQELDTKETLDVHGHPVYDEPLQPKHQDAEQLTSLLSAKDSYEPYNPRKKCGGFSAELCIEWATADSPTQILISLECGEVQIYSPKSQLHCDVTPDIGQKLKQILTPYRKHPPDKG